MPAHKYTTASPDTDSVFAPYIPLYTEPTFKKDELLFDYTKKTATSGAVFGDFTKFVFPLIRRKHIVQLELFDANWL
jgi:hypothetical protein